MSGEYPIEPEESIEAALVSFISAVTELPVVGVMGTASAGSVQRLTADTFIGVSVDQNSQDMDFRGAHVPMSYGARVVVHYALADDATGAAFRDECRKVRSILASFTGDACTDLDVDSFECDAFYLDSTSTNFESGDNPTNTKTYNATIRGRISTTTNTEA